MAFSIERNVTPVKVYHELAGTQADGTLETVTVTYEITSLSSLEGATGVAVYKIMLGDSERYSSFPFTYSGDGNPLEEAEEELKKSLGK